MIETYDSKIPDDICLANGVSVIECVQETPCNRCVDVCLNNAVLIKNSNSRPDVDYSKCIGCSACVEVCSELAIFFIKVHDDRAKLTFPYMFSPTPQTGNTVIVLDRNGKQLCDAFVTRVKQRASLIVTIEIPSQYVMIARNIIVP